jgi:hypothetical protein
MAPGRVLGIDDEHVALGADLDARLAHGRVRGVGVVHEDVDDAPALLGRAAHPSMLMPALPVASPSHRGCRADGRG